MLELPKEPAVDYYFGSYRLDGRLRRLYKDGEAIVLTPKAVDTLVVLLERAGRVVEKDELLNAVWGGVFVGEETLAQNVSTLRRVLADDPSRPLFIATVPRRGYRFVASVRPVPLQTPGEASGRPPNARPKRGGLVLLVGTAALAAVIGGLATNWFSVRNPPPAPVEFTVPEPPGGRFSSTGGMLAVSPDGAYLSFVIIDANGSTSLWLRPLRSTVARQLNGTDGAENPFWSPDSRTIAFFADRRLKAVDAISGTVRVIASLASPRSMGGTWSRKGQILYSVPTDGMYVVAAAGGSPQRVVPAVDAECEGCAAFPQFLPDSRRFLYTLIGSDTSRSGIYVGEIGKPAGERLLDALSSSMYTSPGLLSYARAGHFYVQRLDPARMRVTGSPIPLSDSVAYNARTGRVVATISETGVLAYRDPLITELEWVDRTGKPQGVAAPPGTYLDFSIAPDGQRVAAARVDPRSGTSDIWVFDDGLKCV